MNLQNFKQLNPITMKIYSINPNNGKYFEDKTPKSKIYYDSMLIHNGIYHSTPIYPLFTFSVNGRYDYNNTKCTVYFYTMLHIKRFWNEYLVEVRFSWELNVYQEDALDDAIIEFHKFCFKNIRHLNMKTIISQCV